MPLHMRSWVNVPADSKLETTVTLDGAASAHGRSQTETGGALGAPVEYGNDEVCGGMRDGMKIKAVIPGGSSVPPLPASMLDTGLDFESMNAAGTFLGSGGVIVIDDQTCLVDALLNITRFYCHESCGKCTPCREGTNWTVTMLERIDAGEATPMDLEIMASVQEHIIGNCLCVLGDAMAMPIGSMIEKFRPQFEAYMETTREAVA